MRTLLTLFFVLTLVAFTHADERKKTYEKKISKGDLEELFINNTRGRVEVTQYAGEEIEIIAEMKVIAKTMSKADETLELIQVIETVVGRNLLLETQIGQGVGITRILKGLEVSVDYKVKIPQGIKLRLISSNGDVYIGDFEGEINMDIQNGDIKAANLKGGEVNIKHDKGRFHVENVAMLEGEFRNSTLYIGTGEKVRLITFSCEGELGSIDHLNVRSSAGTLKIGDVEDVVGSSSFTKYEIKDLANLLDMEMKMGEMNVRNVQPFFSEIRLKSSFTKVGFAFSSQAEYELELKRNKALKTDFTQAIKWEESSDKEKNTLFGARISGQPKQVGKVFLELSSGSLFIQ